MRLYLHKLKCDIYEDLNGQVFIIETDHPILVEEYSSQQLLHPSDDAEFGLEDKPFLTSKPDKYQI